MRKITLFALALSLLLWLAMPAMADVARELLVPEGATITLHADHAMIGEERYAIAPDTSITGGAYTIAIAPDAMVTIGQITGETVDLAIPYSARLSVRGANAAVDVDTLRVTGGATEVIGGDFSITGGALGMRAARAVFDGVEVAIGAGDVAVEAGFLAGVNGAAITLRTNDGETPIRWMGDAGPAGLTAGLEDVSAQFDSEPRSFLDAVLASLDDARLYLSDGSTLTVQQPIDETGALVQTTDPAGDRLLALRALNASLAGRPNPLAIAEELSAAPMRASAIIVVSAEDDAESAAVELTVYLKDLNGNALMVSNGTESPAPSFPYATAENATVKVAQLLKRAAAYTGRYTFIYAEFSLDGQTLIANAAKMPANAEKASVTLYFAIGWRQIDLVAYGRDRVEVYDDNGDWTGEYETELTLLGSYAALVKRGDAITGEFAAAKTSFDRNRKLAETKPALPYTVPLDGNAPIEITLFYQWDENAHFPLFRATLALYTGEVSPDALVGMQRAYFDVGSQVQYEDLAALDFPQGEIDEQKTRAANAFPITGGENDLVDIAIVLKSRGYTQTVRFWDHGQLIASRSLSLRAGEQVNFYHFAELFYTYENVSQYDFIYTGDEDRMVTIPEKDITVDLQLYRRALDAGTGGYIQIMLVQGQQSRRYSYAFQPGERYPDTEEQMLRLFGRDAAGYENPHFAANIDLSDYLGQPMKHRDRVSIDYDPIVLDAPATVRFVFVDGKTTVYEMELDFTICYPISIRQLVYYAADSALMELHKSYHPLDYDQSFQPEPGKVITVTVPVQKVQIAYQLRFVLADDSEVCAIGYTDEIGFDGSARVAEAMEQAPLKNLRVVQRPESMVLSTLHLEGHTFEIVVAPAGKPGADDVLTRGEGTPIG